MVVDVCSDVCWQRWRNGQAEHHDENQQKAHKGASKFSYKISSVRYVLFSFFSIVAPGSGGQECFCVVRCPAGKVPLSPAKRSASMGWVPADVPRRRLLTALTIKCTIYSLQVNVFEKKLPKSGVFTYNRIKMSGKVTGSADSTEMDWERTAPAQHPDQGGQSAAVMTAATMDSMTPLVPTTPSTTPSGVHRDVLNRSVGVFEEQVDQPLSPGWCWSWPRGCRTAPTHATAPPCPLSGRGRNPACRSAMGTPTRIRGIQQITKAHRLPLSRPGTGIKGKGEGQGTGHDGVLDQAGEPEHEA